MHNLFTPVQVTKDRTASYPPEALLRFQEQLYAITQPRVLSLADERKKIISWFRSLPLLERRHVATFHSPEFACLLSRLFLEWKNSKEPFKYRFSLRENKYWAQPQRIYRSYCNYREREQELLDQILLVSRSQIYQAVTLSDTLLKEPETFFQILEDLQGGIIQTLGQFTKQQMESSRVVFNIEGQNQAKLLGVWVGTFLMKQISLFFLNKTTLLIQQCEHHRNQEKQYCNLWQELSFEQKQKFLQPIFNKDPEQIIINYFESLDVHSQKFPMVTRQSEAEMIKRWKNCSPKQLMNQLTFTPLINSFEVGNLYRIQLILDIESLLAQKAKSIKNKNKKAKKKKKKEQNMKNSEVSICSSIKFAEKQRIFPTQKPLIVKEEEIKSQVVEESKMDDVLSQETNFTQDEKIIFGTKEEICDEKVEIKEQFIEDKDQVFKETLEKSILNAKLQEIYKKLKDQNRDRARKLILNRLIHILSQVGVSCKPYGSYTTQLSLPDSDLDISVDSSILNFFSLQSANHRNQVILVLHFIANILNKYYWIKDFQLLDRAKVPLLSFSADASQYFELRPQQKIKLRMNSKKIDPEKGLVRVDITVQPLANTPQLPHCGLQSTESLKAWIKVFPLLQKTVLLLKLLLRKKNLNKTFEGGMGSYGISLLVIAYLRQQDEEMENVAQLLQGLATFLQQFYSQKWSIDPEGQVPLIKQYHMNGPIMKHPFDGHNILDKSSKFSSVVEAIGQWKVLCEEPLIF